MEAFILSIFTILVVLIISALPLHIAVKLLGGKTYLIKTILVMFISSVIIVLIALILPFGGIIAFIVLIWMYREMFRLKWHKALFAWILQLLFVAILFIILSIIGVGVGAVLFTSLLFM